MRTPAGIYYVRVSAYDSTGRWSGWSQSLEVRITGGMGSVGGYIVPVDKIGLLAQYIGLASTTLIVITVTTIYVKRFKHKKQKQ